MLVVLCNEDGAVGVQILTEHYWVFNEELNNVSVLQATRVTRLHIQLAEDGPTSPPPTLGQHLNGFFFF